MWMRRCVCVCVYVCVCVCVYRNHLLSSSPVIGTDEIESREKWYARRHVDAEANVSRF